MLSDSQNESCYLILLQLDRSVICDDKKKKNPDEIYRMKLGNNHCVILLGVISSSDRNCSSSLSRRADIFCFQK